MKFRSDSAIVAGVGVLLLSVLTACGGGERKIVEPPPTGSSNFTLTVRPDAEDAGVAQQLGWTAGIPGAEVSVVQSGSGGSGQTFTTSATGTVSINALQSGTYRISVRRLFTGAETARLGAGSDAVAFVGENEVAVSSSPGSATVSIPASYRRSLVISEWSFRLKYTPGGFSTETAGFLELYNNSDATVYLDGVIIADAYFQAVDYPNFSCALTEPFRNDPAGLWTRFVAAFPGKGRDLPLAPGANVVIATDAIDHRAFDPDLVDLRGANFEFIGTADVDNPTVPNMIDHSLADFFGGHGLSFRSPLGGVTAVGAAVDPGTLMRSGVPPNGRQYLRVPRSTLLDVMATGSQFQLNNPTHTLCPQILNVAMDRKAGFFLLDSPTDYQQSIGRKVLMKLPGGRIILQHTRTSANDYQRTPRTPGSVQE